MVKTLLSVFLALSCMASAPAALVSYWNFNGLSVATASAPGAGGVPLSISADQGSGTLSLSAWGGLVDDFAGSATNAIAPDVAEESLSLVSGGPAAGPFPGNGSFLDLSFSLTGFENPVVTFAGRGTATGFNTGSWSWSTDGINFNPIGGNTATVSTTFALLTQDFSAADGLDQAASVTLRYTLTGATSNSGNNRIDNLQINASPVPEPSSSVAMLTGLALLGWRRRR